MLYHYQKSSYIPSDLLTGWQAVLQDELLLNDITTARLDHCRSEIKNLTNKTVDAILSVSNDKRNFANTVEPLINNDAALSKYNGILAIAQYTHNDKDIRDKAEEAVEELSDFSVEVDMRKDLYAAFNHYENNNLQFEKHKLSHEQQRYVDEMRTDYRRNGLELSDDNYLQLKAIKKKIEKLELEFQKNSNEENTCFEFTKDELKGLPDSWFTGERKISADLYKATLKYPDYFPISEHCENRAVREKMYIAFSSRCITENTPLFEQVIALRQQQAELLGYSCHAEYALEKRMSKNILTTQSFLDNINDLLAPVWDKEHDDLLALAREHSHDKNFKLEMWDLNFYIRINKEKRCDIDLEAVKEYFPLNTVTQGLFKIYQELLGVKFYPVDSADKWHETVKIFDVYDYNHNTHTQHELRGRFYLDLFPRQGKYGHAAAFDLISRADISAITAKNNELQLPQAMMVCNFEEHGNMKFENVVTYFHEFGHVMHMLLNKAQLAKFNSFLIEGDFVEAPSQMLEFWCYKKEALQLMSGHEKTGSQIPESLIEKLQQTKLVNVGYKYKRQLTFGLFDLKLHILPVAKQDRIDSAEIFRETLKSTLGLNEPKETNFAANFGHLMSEYAAGYYGYLWALVRATDMFETYFAHDVLNPEAGRHYRKTILEPGATLDASEILINFLGRETQPEPFLRSLGFDSDSSCGNEPAKKRARSTV